MLKNIGEAFALIIPLLFSGVVHMVIVKWDCLSWSKYPIHERLFGRNKTWRGFVVMPLATAFGLIVLGSLFEVALWNAENPILLGLCLGIAYVAFELPNSFIKRRLGVAPGKVPQRNRWVFILLDHIDSLTGGLLVYALFFPELSVLTFLLTAVIAPAVHLLVNAALYFSGLRKELL